MLGMIIFWIWVGVVFCVVYVVGIFMFNGGLVWYVVDFILFVRLIVWYLVENDKIVMLGEGFCIVFKGDVVLLIVFFWWRFWKWYIEC